MPQTSPTDSATIRKPISTRDHVSPEEARSRLVDTIISNHRVLSGSPGIYPLPQLEGMRAYKQDKVCMEIINLQNLVLEVIDTDTGVSERFTDKTTRFRILNRGSLWENEELEKFKEWMVWVLGQTEGDKDGDEQERRKSVCEDWETGTGLGQVNEETFCGEGDATMVNVRLHEQTRTPRTNPSANVSKGLDLVQMREDFKRGIINVKDIEKALDSLVDEYEMRYL